MPRVYINHLGQDYLSVVREGFEWVRLSAILKRGDRVALKPNLTFPVFRQGVMTNPEALEAVVLHLKEFTDRITICESDSGGYNRFSMDEVFARTGISEFAERHGVRVVNMSYARSRPIRFRSGFQRFSMPLPALLLDETDLFVSLPVPKVHSNAMVSLALKNQWGIIQEPGLRLKLHPYFKEVIYHVNKALPRSLAVVDGKYGLNRSGPLRGNPVKLDWLLVSDNLFVTDAVVCEIMGFDWHDIPHLGYALRKERIHSLAGVEFNADYRAFEKEKFYLAREWTDYPGVLAFHSRLLAYIGYESVLARPLHWLLYRFREPFY